MDGLGTTYLAHWAKSFEHPCLDWLEGQRPPFTMCFVLAVAQWAVLLVEVLL